MVSMEHQVQARDVLELVTVIHTWVVVKELK